MGIPYEPDVPVTYGERVVFETDPVTGYVVAYTVDSSGRRTGFTILNPRTTGGSGGGGGYAPPGPAPMSEYESRYLDHLAAQLGLSRDELNFRIDLANRQLGLDQNRFDFDRTRYWNDAAFRDRELASQVALRNAELQQRAAEAVLDYQAAMARIGVEAQNAQNQYQIGMANATNDAERNRIQAWWYQKQAELEMMADQTRRELGYKEAQIKQFAAETERAAAMGNLALENNKFIAEMARSPRDLFGLFFMQRGITPDWDTMAAGGTPAMGQALVPVNPMTAYTPTTQPVQFDGTVPTNPMLPTTGAYTPSANPWLSGGAGGGGGGSGGGGSFVPPPVDMSLFPGPVQVPTLTAPNAPGTGAPEYSGVPYEQVQNMAPGQLALVVTGNAGPTRRSDFRPEFDVAVGGQDNWITDPDYVIPAGTPIWLRRKAGGGGTNAPVVVVGDAPERNPEAGGARPEVVLNPTGAPLHVVPNPKTVREAGLPVRREAMQMYDYAVSAAREQDPRASAALAAAMDYGVMRPGPGAARLVSKRPAGTTEPMTYEPRQASWLADYGAIRSGPPAPRQAGSGWMYRAAGMAGAVPDPAATGLLPVGYQPVSSPGLSYQAPVLDFIPAGPLPGLAYQAPVLNYIPPGPVTNPVPASVLRGIGARQGPASVYRTVARYPLGTQSAYEAVGMGSMYMPSSTNAHLTGQQLPRRLQMLMDYGAPISPALAAAATGGVAPTLNLGSAVTQGRQAGVLPSLQRLSDQTRSETEHTRGYYEGVAGVPWADIVDWISKPTSFLGRVQTAGRV